MEIYRENGIIFLNEEKEPETGVVFLLCHWSKSRLYLRYLISILESYPTIDLYVIDIDHESFQNFKKKINVISHGNGETFWLYKGKQIESILDYNTDQNKTVAYMEKLLRIIRGEGTDTL